VRLGRRAYRLGPLYAGEELRWEGVLDAPLLALLDGRPVHPERRRRGPRPWLEAWGRSLAGEGPLSAVHPADREVPSRADCHPRGPATRAGGVSDATAPIALAEPLDCGPRPPTEPRASAGEPRGRGVPAETLLQMLRARIVPVARGCFRRDRAGRPDYATRAVFRFRLADREVARAEVEGAIRDELRQCLLAAIDGLEVPPFEGVVDVSYPLTTQRAEREPRIELERRVREAVDRAVGEEASAPALGSAPRHTTGR